MTANRYGYLLLFVALLSAACGGSPETPAAGVAETIKIGAVVPLTGRFGAGGAQVARGYELAVEAINAAGGVTVQGRQIPLELIMVDDESDPARTVQRLEELNTRDQVVAYLGGFGSDLHAAAAGIAEKNKIPYLGVAFAFQGIHSAGFRYIFSPFPKSPELARTTFDLFDELEPRPSILFGVIEKTDWGVEMSTAWEAEASRRGYTYQTDTYAPGTRDFSSIILRARDAGAAAVLSLPNPADGLALVKQMKELAYSPDITVLVRAADGPTWPQNLGKDGDFVLLMTGWNSDIRLEGVAEMNAAHVGRYDAPATPITGPAYNLLLVLQDALSRSAGLDRESLRAALAATQMERSLIGPVAFRPDGSSDVLTVVSQYQDGRPVSIWPPALAASAIIYPSPDFQDR